VKLDGGAVLGVRTANLELRHGTECQRAAWKEHKSPASNSDDGEGGGGAGASGGGAACAKCGIRSVELKSCARCLQEAYCSKECQVAAWKEHKISCRGQEGQGQLLSLDAIRRRVADAAASGDWSEVLRWEGRLEELAAVGQDPETVAFVLQAFARAYNDTAKWDKAGLLWVRCAEVCGALKLFSIQVDILTNAGKCFVLGMDWKNAALWFENARDVSKEQGFVTRECELCSTLGGVFSNVGRHSEAVEQHRRAFRVAQSVGEDDASHDRASLERMALRFLVEVLCQRDGHLEEAEALVTRLRERGGNTADCQLWNHYLRGVVQMQRQNFQAAAEAFRAAVAVAEKHPAVLQDLNSAGALKSAKANLKNCDVGVGGAPPRSTIVRMVEKAWVSRDWAGVLRWESRLEDLLTLPEAEHPQLIESFAVANLNQGHFAKAASLFQRSVQILGKLERFTEQGAAMCRVGECFLRLNDAKGAETWYQKARKLGEKHGCYAVECSA
ncbi:hypothetical protein T484DRAFT_1868176, partial [Baffinella frigidus]